VTALTYNFTEAAFKMTCPVWICFVWAMVAVPMASRLSKARLIDVEKNNAEDDIVLIRIPQVVQVR